MITLDQSELEEAAQDCLTLRDCIRWGVSQFNRAELYFGHDHADAWDEAVFLALHAVHLSPKTDDRVLDARLTKRERQAVLSLLAKRVNKRLPAAYLVEEAWFAGMPFFVDQRVLIPRSPIAELIETGFAPWLQTDVTHILDLCTGSGCIAIACANVFPHAIVDAVDIDRAALDVCAINVEQHNMVQQVRVIQSDLFMGLDVACPHYQLIVSNPPYVSDEEWQSLPAEYKHEPSSALLADEDGLTLVKRILCDAGGYLTDDGILVVEVGNSADALIKAFPEVPFTWVEFERGGHGVFLLTAQQVKTHQAVFAGSIAYVRE